MFMISLMSMHLIQATFQAAKQFNVLKPAIG